MPVIEISDPCLNYHWKKQFEVGVGSVYEQG